MGSSTNDALAYERVRDAITAYFEVLADATDPSAPSLVRAAAARRVPLLGRHVLLAVEARHGTDSAGEQLTAHPVTLHRDGPAEVMELTRVYAGELVSGDLLHGWFDSGGVRFWQPRELVAAFFTDGCYACVRTAAGRDLILDGLSLVAISPRST